MRYRFVTADVFTDQIFGGNPLAVLPDARGLDAVQMQAIAREFNLSETVFVLPPDSAAHTRRLRIFTPASEIPFAGHPTVGAALVLASLGEIEIQDGYAGIIFEEDAGPVPVEIEARGDRPPFAWLSAPKAPEFRAAPDASALAAMLSLAPADVLARDGLPAAVSCGLPVVIVQLRTREALGRARLDRAAWERGLRGQWADLVYLFTEDAPEGFDFQARMFAPGAGIEEDPATGSAAAALGGWLGRFKAKDDGHRQWRIAQGIEMGRPSQLAVETTRREVELQRVRVGGAAVRIMEGTLAAPTPADPSR
jgi:trans-2,3-dihydro-3-hydroxyanthranilate isomerase